MTRWSFVYNLPCNLKEILQSLSSQHNRQGKERFVRSRLFGLYQMELSIPAANSDLELDEDDLLDMETEEGNPVPLQKMK